MKIKNAPIVDSVMRWWLTPALVLGFVILAPATFAQEEDSTALLEQLRRKQEAAARGGASGARVKTAPKPAEGEEAEGSGGGGVAMNLEEGPARLAGLVDQYGILRDTLQQRAEAQLGEAADALMEEEYLQILRRVEDKLLEEWAINTVLSEVARDHGITVSRKEMKERLDELAAAGGHPGEPETALADYGINIRDYITELSQAVLTEKLVFKAMDRSLSEEYWKRLYDNNRDQFYQPPKVKLRAIVKDLSLSSNDEETLDKLDEMKAARKRLRRGADFGEVAREVSDARISAERDGLMGWIQPDNALSRPADTLIFELVPGRLSDLVISDSGRFVYIFRVDEKVLEEIQPFEKVRYELRFLVYDQWKRQLYLKNRKAFKVILNAGGIDNDLLSEIDRSRLKIF